MTEPSKKSAPVTVTAFGLSDMGQVRGNNEDAFMVADLAHASDRAAPTGLVNFDVSSEPVLLAVSDGMGGANAGEVASALVVESLTRAMTDAQGDWTETIKSAVERANADVFNASKEPGKRGMGATLTAVCLHGDQAHVAEVGDSRAYVVRGNRIRQITRDQSFVQILIDSGALKPEDAAKNPMKNVVLQAMGQSAEVKVAIGRLELRRGDRLLLCSDGLSNKVTDEEMKEALGSGAALDEATKKLIALANERGGDDNITVVVAEVGGEGLSPHREVESLTQTFQVLAEFKATSLDDPPPPEDEDGMDEPEPPVDPGEAPVRTRPARAAAPAPPPAMGASMVLVAVGAGLLLALLVIFFLTRR
jgi:serine/threonine protein phosphatase PrpC